MAASASRPSALPLPDGLGIGISLLLALSGQVMLSNAAVSPALGIGLYASAALVFVLALRRSEPSLAPLVIGAQAAPAPRPRLALWFTALAFTAITVQGVLAPEQTPWRGRSLLVLWAVSMVLFSFSVLHASGWTARANVRAWYRANWQTALLAALFGLAAFAVRVYDLELHPYAFVNDEGEVGVEALRILRGERTDFFNVAWASQPVWAFVPAAVSVKLLGPTAFAVRLVSALQGALTVSALFLLGREWFGTLAGALGATVLLALPFHVHFSRLGVNNVGDAFFSTLTLYLTYRALRRGTPAAFLLAGLATGGALYTYLGSRLAMALVFGSLLYVGLRRSELVLRHSGALLAFAGAVLVVALPMAAYFYKTPNQFFARINAEGILNNGFLQRQAEATGQTQARVLLDQFSRSSLVYVARPAPASFFNSPQPYLTPLAAIFFGLGMGYTVWRLRDPRYMTLFVWFWSVVILGSTLTVGPPSSQRLLMSAPALALLVAIGLQKAAQLSTQGGLLSLRAGQVLCGLIVVFTAAQGLAFYFGEYRQGHYFEDPSNDFSYEVAVYAKSLGPDHRTLLLGDPSVYAIFGNFRYLAIGVEVVDYNTVTLDTFEALARDKSAAFVAVPSRVEDLRLIAQWAPGGTWREVDRRYQPSEPLYFAYEVPLSALSGPE